jgi:CheY-like chemotaxis protein
MLRILLVEDDKNRVKQIKEWLSAEEARLVHAGSAGTAIGVIKKDCTKHSIVYDGIMLDHDLQGQTVTEKDLFLSGADVVKEIIARVSNEIPVLVHSMNPTDAPRMVHALTHAGFSVTRIPMVVMTQENLNEWLQEVRECWEDRQE